MYFRLDTSSLQARIVKFSFNREPTSFTNYCPFFWISLVALLCSPVIAIARLLTYLIELFIKQVWVPGFTKFMEAMSPIANLIEKDRWWNQEKIDTLASTVDGIFVLSELHHRYGHSFSKEGIRIQRMLHKATKIIAATLAKAGAFDDTPGWNIEEEMSVFWLLWKDSHHFRNLFARVTPPSDAVIMSEFDKQRIRTNNRIFIGIVLASIPFVLGIAGNLGILFMLKWLAGIAIGLLLGIGIVWAIPYMRAVYNKVCPQIIWTTKETKTKTGWGGYS